MVIGAVDQSDACVWMAQMLAEGKPPETSPQDNDMPRVLVRHAQTVREGGGCVKGRSAGGQKKASKFAGLLAVRSRTSSLRLFGWAPADCVTRSSGRRSDVDCPISRRWFDDY